MKAVIVLAPLSGVLVIAFVVGFVAVDVVVACFAVHDAFGAGAGYGAGYGANGCANGATRDGSDHAARDGANGYRAFGRGVLAITVRLARPDPERLRVPSSSVLLWPAAARCSRCATDSGVRSPVLHARHL